MKAGELRILVLSLAVTLGLAFVLGQWQAKALRKELAMLQAQHQALQLKVEAEQERLNHTQIAVRNATAEHDRAIAVSEVQLAAVREARNIAIKEPQRVPFYLLKTAKGGFNDIQHQVAAGRFSGLALTDGYMELKKIFDNPAFEEMLASEHSVTGQ